jgi:hypothetical protein
MSLRVIAPAFAQTAATKAIPDVAGAGGGGHGGAMKACKADRQTYCADIEKGGGRVMKCMKEHADKLSPSCKDALAAIKAERQGK